MSRSLRIGEAIDLFVGDLARQGRKSGTLLDYRYKLNLLADDLKNCYVDEIELADYERFLNRWVGKAASTLAGAVSLVHVFSKFLWERGYTATDVARPTRRPRKPRPEDLDVVTVSTGTSAGCWMRVRAGRSSCAWRPRSISALGVQRWRGFGFVMLISGQGRFGSSRRAGR